MQKEPSILSVPISLRRNAYVTLEEPVEERYVVKSQVQRYLFDLLIRYLQL